MAEMSDSQVASRNHGSAPVHNTSDPFLSLSVCNKRSSTNEDVHPTEDNTELNDGPPEIRQCEAEHIQLLENATSPDELVNLLSDQEIPDILSESLTDVVGNNKRCPPQKTCSAAEVGSFEHTNKSNVASYTHNSQLLPHWCSTEKQSVDKWQPLKGDTMGSTVRSQNKFKQGRGRPKKLGRSPASSSMNQVSSDTTSHHPPSLDPEQITQEENSGKTDADKVNLDKHYSEDSEHPKKKRGRPPKLKADSLCARTVPYGWKSKTREQRLADFKLLLSQCEDVEPERNSSSLEMMSQQASSSQLSQPSVHSSNSEPFVHSDNNTEQDITLSDNRDFHQPHVSPDSGISAGGSPAHIVASPHLVVQHPVVLEDSIQDGPPTLEPMVFNTKSSRSPHNVTSPPLCDSNAQTLYSKVQSSHKHSTVLDSTCDLQRSMTSKNGRGKIYQSENSSDTQSRGKNSQVSVYAADISVKRKRGRPKGSSLALKGTKPPDSSKSLTSPSQGNNVESQGQHLQMPFVAPYMNAYPYVLPQNNTSQMADYLDNIFERFQAEQSGLNKNESGTKLPSEECPQNLMKQKPSGDSDILKKHRLSNNMKLSKKAKSAIKSKLSRALKLSGFSRDINFKRKRGRPKINPQPVENLKRGRGRPRKIPMTSQILTSVPNDTQSSRKPSSYKVSKKKLKPTQYVPNTTTSESGSNLKFCHPVSKVSFKSQSNSKEIEDFNIGPPVLFSEESLSPDILLKGKPGDEFDKLMHSLQPVHARISAKFHRRLSEMDRTEDGMSSDSDSELAMSQSQNELLKENKKLVPTIRKAKLQVTPPKKRGRKKKCVSERSELYIDPEYQAEFSLPPSAYAFHKMSPCTVTSKDIPTERITSHSVRCNSPITNVAGSEHSRGLPKSPPPAHLNMSPGSQAGSTVSALSRQSEELHDGRRRNKKKKSRHFKSKHKNIVDPVFVAEVENLATDIENIKLSDLQQATYSNVIDSPMSVPVVFHFGKRTSKALLKATGRQHKSFKSKSAFTQLKKARKRRQIQDGLDMARKKHILLKKKSRMIDQAEGTRRPRGRPRKKPPMDGSIARNTDKGHESVDGNRSEDECLLQSNVSDSELTADKAENTTTNAEMSGDVRQNTNHKGKEVTLNKKLQQSKDLNSTKRGPGRPRKIPGKNKDISQKKQLAVPVGNSINETKTEDLAKKEAYTNCSNTGILQTQSTCTSSSCGNSVQTDFEVQCDLEPEVEEAPQPAKTTVDVGIQVDPQELKQLASAHKKQLEKAEIGIQVQNEDSNDGKIAVPVTQPLEIQVNFDEVSENEDDVNLLSEDSAKSLTQLTPQQCSPRQYSHNASEGSSVDKTQLNNSCQDVHINLVKETEEKMFTDTNTDTSAPSQNDREGKVSTSHKKKGKSSSKKGKRVSSCSPKRQSGASLNNDPTQSPRELEKECSANEKLGKVLSPKNTFEEKNMDDKDSRLERDHISSCPKKGSARVSKKSKHLKTVEKETVQVLDTGSSNVVSSEQKNESGSQLGSNTASESHEYKDVVTKSKSKGRAKPMESVEEALSPNSVGDKFVESVTAAAKCGVISEISYEDFCKENEGDTQGEPKTQSKSAKKRNESASSSKTSEHMEKKKSSEVPKLPLPSGKPQFQAAFESFLSTSSAPVSQLECEDNKMKSFFDGMEEVPFPAPETVDLTEGMEHTFSADNSVPNDPVQQKEATCDDNVIKSKSKKGKKCPKKKRNQNSISKVQRENDIAKEIEIIEDDQGSSNNTRVNPERCLLNDVDQGGSNNTRVNPERCLLSDVEQGGSNNTQVNPEGCLLSDVEQGGSNNTQVNPEGCLLSDVEQVGSNNTQVNPEEHLLSDTETLSEEVLQKQLTDDVIVLSETDEETDHRGCPECARLQRACRGGSRRCRHRSSHTSRDFNRERKHPDNLSPVSANSHKSHSGTDSDRECVVILERLHASQLPRTPQAVLDDSEEAEGAVGTSTQNTLSVETPSLNACEIDGNQIDDVTVIPDDNENHGEHIDNELCNSNNTQSSNIPDIEVSTNHTPVIAESNRKKHKKFSSKFKSKRMNETNKMPLTTTLSRHRKLSKHPGLLKESRKNERVELPAVVHNIDDSDNEVEALHNRDTSPVICTIKRKNTNSEYEPLPVMKKKRKLQNDMGYSQPKRRRRRKSTVSLSSQIQPSTPTSLMPLSIEIETIDLSMYDSSQDENASQTESESIFSSRPGTPARKAMDGPQLPKKRYQKAGLFSTTYKGDERVKRKKHDLKNVVYDPADLEFGLIPAPIHVGKYMREKRIDFCLPYDIWWMHENNMLKPLKMLSPKYKKIRNNVYVDCRPVCKYETHACNCRKPNSPGEVACGENCLNRMIYTECNPSTCPCKDQCSNQRFQKHEEQEGLQKFVTSDRGQGVHCNKEISTGTFVIEYVGEVITEGEFQDRMSEEYANDRHHYCLNLDSGLVIDGYRMGNLSRFVNHSCDPNCEMQKWNVNGVYRMGLFANQDIPLGAELSYNYNFHSYNLDAQQECRCGSDKCRGVLGGKVSHKFNGLLKEKISQSLNKDKEKSKSKHKKKDKEKEPCSSSKVPSQQSSPVKPLSHRERCLVQKRAIFLLRNLSKVKQVRQKSTPPTPIEENGNPFMGRTDPTPEQDCFHTQLMALNTARTVKTRGLSVAQDNEEVSRVAKLAQIFQIIFVSVQTFKGDKGEVLSVPLQQCPSRKKHPEYYQLIEEPIDLNTIETKVTTGQYKSLEAFEGEFLRLFKNVEKYCGKKSEIGQAVGRLKKVFYTAKTECLPGLEELLGESSQTSAPSECSSLDTNDDKMEDEEEEIIRCVCNIYRDEGVMIQCEKCEKWQHADCMGEPDVEKYMCELCDPRPLSKEVLMKPPPDDAKPECTYYLTLLRDNLQARVGDAVYIVKDTNLVKTDGVKIKLDYDDLAKDVTQLDIFRVETLWKNESGEKFAFGHHYLRPHETFHEPNRKFFDNEVFRIPLYEIVPLEAVVMNCVVMDLPTYCKGRPKDVYEKDVYICEYRIDKNARMFNKIGKPKYPINTKSYCFDRFLIKMYPKRTYSPHEVPDQYKKKCYTRMDSDQISESGRSVQTVSTDPGNESDEDIPLAQLKRIKMKKKKKRLNVLCEKLLSHMTSKQEDSRARPERSRREKITLETLFPT